MSTTMTQARALVRETFSVRLGTARPDSRRAGAPAPWLVGAAAFAALTGMAMGSAYIGGSVARAMTVKAEAKRLAGAAEARYSNDSVIYASGVDAMTDAGALAIARRHDPYRVAGAAERDREATLIAAKLVAEAPLQQTSSLTSLFGLRKASFTATAAARPFRMPGALEASRDLDCLSQAVYFEARGEGVSGMQAVAQVVLNRVRHPAFPKTVCGVVFQGAGDSGCQFSFACDGSMHRAVEPMAWRRSREVAAKALSGRVMAEVGNATHFHTIQVQPGWRSNMLRIAQVGAHVFYRFGGPAGAPDAFHYQPRPSGSIESVKTVAASFVPPEAVTEPVRSLVQGLEDVARPQPRAEEPKVEPAKVETPTVLASAEAAKQ